MLNPKDRVSKGEESVPVRVYRRRGVGRGRPRTGLFLTKSCAPGPAHPAQPDLEVGGSQALPRPPATASCPTVQSHQGVCPSLLPSSTAESRVALPGSPSRTQPLLPASGAVRSARLPARWLRQKDYRGWGGRRRGRRRGPRGRGGGDRARARRTPRIPRGVVPLPP